MRIGIRLPIRWKIVALIASSLALSLLSYVYMGTHLIVDDKVTYIYDHSQTRVQMMADAVDAQVEKAQAVATLLAQLAGSEVADGDGRDEALSNTFRTLGIQAGLSTFLLLRAENDTSFVVARALGERTQESEELLGKLGWRPSVFAQRNFLVGPSRENTIPIGGRTSLGDGNSVAYLAIVSLDLKSFRKEGASPLKLLDATGIPIQAEPAALDAALFESEFDSSVRDWTGPEGETIVAYHRLRHGRMMAVGYTPKAVAFKAVHGLVRRSLVMGLSVLSLGIAVTLLFARSLTGRLRRIWNVTQGIARGDFTARVSFANDVRDEVSDLAFSFNTMADKIDELMEKSAEKARLQKELETAQTVQSWFFPAEGFEDAQLKLSGRYLPASECAGDWWSYARHGDRLIVVIGDVTGHGVSAALMTAVAHGAFTVFNESLRRDSSSQDSAGSAISHLVEHLNDAILNAAGNKSMMTFVAAEIDLRTGKLWLCNASHCTPYLLRPPAEGGGETPYKFIPLTGGKGMPLGYDRDLKIEAAAYQLEPGDTLLWFTDGLIECENPAGKRLPKKTILQSLAASHSRESEAAALCQGLMQDFMTFLEEAGNSRADDVTVVLATIPAKTRFAARPAAEAA